jgi:hypothetical protein
MVSFIKRNPDDPGKPGDSALSQAPLVMNRRQISFVFKDIFGLDPTATQGVLDKVYRQSATFNGTCDLYAEWRDGSNNLLPGFAIEACPNGMRDTRIGSNGVLTPMAAGYLSNACELTVNQPGAVDYAVRAALRLAVGASLPSSVGDSEIRATWALFYPDQPVTPELLTALRALVQRVSGTPQRQFEMLLLTASLSGAWTLL